MGIMVSAEIDACLTRFVGYVQVHPKIVLFLEQYGYAVTRQHTCGAGTLWECELTSLGQYRARELGLIKEGPNG